MKQKINTMNKSILIMIVAIFLPMSLMAGNVKPTKTTKVMGWLAENLKYPKAAAEDRVEGTVYVSFTVNENGQSENVKIEEGLSPEINSEALKAVSNMPMIELYTAESPDKKYILPIKFSVQ
jgi:TonB family protein